MAKPIHVFQTFIRADTERVWQALTDPEFTRQYFHAQRFESSLEPGSSYRYVGVDGNDSVVGTIEEVDPPRRLVMTWRVLYDPAAAAEPPSKVEWTLADAGDGLTRVTTIHRDLGLSPVTSSSVGGGWFWVLGSLKSFAETGEGLPRTTVADDAVEPDGDGEDHRRYAIDANNSAWELLGRDDLSADERDDLLGRAYAAAYHWQRAARRGPENAARASWLLSRTHAVLGHGDLALHHADQCMTAVTAAGLGDFDLAYAHEARSRALACLGRLDEAASERALAKAVEVADDEDRQIVESDLAAEPWYGLDRRYRHGMTVKVELAELARRLDEYGFAYLVTVGDEGRAHVLAVTPELTADGIVAGGIGRHSLANVALHPIATLVWPPVTAGGYSLIVDGTATAADSTVTVTPTKAILHRPAPGEDGQRVGSDCQPVTL